MELKTFQRGIHPKYYKELTKDKATVVMPLPKQVIIPLQQHIGAPCKPLVKLKDEVHVGDVIGDLNRRRGMVQGMDDSPSGKIIRAEVPLAEMFGYATDLRSATQGRATYSMEFAKYAEAPSNVADAVIKKAS